MRAAYRSFLAKEKSVVGTMTRRQGIRIVITGTLAGAAVAGCTEDPQQTAGVVRVANWGSPRVEEDFMSLERRIWDAFEQLHPGTRVQIEQIPGPGMYAPKLIMMHVSGSMPDVIHLDASSAAVFIDNGIVLDLMPFAENDPSFDLDVYFENAVRIAQRGEALYAIPLDFTPMVMYYNKTLFDQLLFRIETPAELQGTIPCPAEGDPYRTLRGRQLSVPVALREALSEHGIIVADDAMLTLELAETEGNNGQGAVSAWRWGFEHGGTSYTVRREPDPAGPGTESLAVYLDEGIAPYPQEGWHWDEFRATCKALADAPNGARYGMSFENWMPGWVMWLWTAGGDVLDETGSRATGTFDGPGSVEAMEFLAALTFEEGVIPTLQQREAIGQDPFLNGDAAMDVKGHWMMLDYRARKFDIGVTTLPTREGPPETVLYEVGLAIPSKAENPEMAWEYIKYFTSEQVQWERTAAGIAISGNKLAAARFAGDPVEDAFHRSVAFARPPWGTRVQVYEFLEGLGWEMMEDIHYNRVPVKDAMRRTARLMDAVLRAQ
jgi:ABC-type glycerol-3-phosphate transport system substrate-binding protein